MSGFSANDGFGVRVAIVSTLSLAATVYALEATRQPPVVEIHDGSRPLARYRYEKVPFKPYVQELFTPSGVNVLRDSPADHKHHHGLMFAVGVNDTDFWGETPKDGRQVQRALRTVGASGGKNGTWAGLVESLEWVGQDKQILLKEERRITGRKTGDGGPTVLTWESTLSAPADLKAVTLFGREYFGLGLRFPVSMDKDGHFMNADGKQGVAGTNATASRWCAYSAKADGKPVTVAVFQEPDSPYLDAPWFTMEQPFAYISATLNLKARPVQLAAEKPLRVRYGVAAWDGSREAAEIEKVYREWVKVAATRPAAK